MIKEMLLSLNPEQVVLIMLVLQIVGYILLDKYKLSGCKYLILGVIIALHIFVLPGIYIQDNTNHEPRCLMPEMAYTFIYWVIGVGSNLLTHVLYILIRLFWGKER